MTNKQKYALILGVCGQDGSILSEQLLEKGYYVVGMKRRSSTHNTKNVDHLYDNPNFKLEYGDINDSSSLFRLIAKYKFDEIYNLAAMSHVRVSFDLSEETFNSTAGGTLRLLNVVKELSPTSKVYIAGSSEMFGVNPEYPQNENTAFIPASPYACSKAFATNIARNYRDSYGLFISVGILFNHESIRRGPTFVTRKISDACARIKLGLQNEITLGNLDAKRDWGWANDFTRGMYLMLQQDKPEDFVLATGETHTVREYLEETFKLAELDPYKHLKIDSRFFRPQEVPYLLGDYSKAKRMLGWEPTVKFNELVKIMYEGSLLEQIKENR